MYEPIDGVYLIEAGGKDLIDCSSGGNVYNATIPAGPGYQVPYFPLLAARELGEEVKWPAQYLRAR